MGVSGSRDTLLSVFNRFDNYPLLIRALAGELARYKRAPGDFDAWLTTHQDFQPILNRLQQGEAKSHVLRYALQGLTEDEQRVLHTIAAFRMPASYDTLWALLVKDNTPISSESVLDTILFNLEDRGVLGWDRAANRYDLHPIVRSVVWGELDSTTRTSIHTARVSHFQPISRIKQDNIEKFEDLTPAVELYYTLIGLGRYDDAFIVFRDHLVHATHYRLSANRQRIELLESLFPDGVGVDHLPRLTKTSAQAYTLIALALAYKVSGLCGQAAPLYRLGIELAKQRNNQRNVSTGLRNLSNALRQSGSLHLTEHAARQALIINHDQSNHFEEASGLQSIGLTLATRHTPFSLFPETEGVQLQNTGMRAAQTALRCTYQIAIVQNQKQLEGTATAFLAQIALWHSDLSAAQQLANRAWKLAHHQGYERDFIAATRLQGEAALGLNDFVTADERLHHALTR
ncbi:MAG TPA: hypothetical protein VHL11_00280, partial [Phototrophicaceae bacterium]|nr:hypothetical protein [Phototrophicaceae bacterium]